MKEYKIVAVSDTHGNYQSLIKLLPIIKENDTFLHLGDGVGDLNFILRENDFNFDFVEGNCDSGFFNQREKVLEALGHKIFLTHGDRYAVKSGLDLLLKKAKEIGASVVFYGHTHQASVKTVEGITFINPGTLSNYAVKQSFAYVVITKNKVTAVINDKFY